MAHEHQKLLLTVREVSALTGLSVGTIYHFASQKRIPVVRLSARCLRFRVVDLQKWIEGFSEPATGDVLAWRNK